MALGRGRSITSTRLTIRAKSRRQARSDLNPGPSHQQAGRGTFTDGSNLSARAGNGHESDPVLARAEEARKSPPPHQPSPEPVESQRHYLRVTIAPRSEADCGIIIEGTFDISGGSVHVYDMRGALLGTEPVPPGDDVEAVARRLLHKGAAPSFYAPLRYPPESMH